MEFKLFTHFGFQPINVYINRITVEFKFRISCFQLVNVCILIESQWNLNNAKHLNSITLSDINRITVEFKSHLIYRTLLYHLHINRITVEFKFSLTKSKALPDLILIESQWNLNFNNFYFPPLLLFILIESQWNLNDVAFNLYVNVKEY